MARRPQPTDFVYFMYCAGSIKIGYSRNPAERLRALSSMIPLEVHLLFILPGDRAEERRLHERFAAERLSGEWFKLSDRLRLFLEDQLAGFIGGIDRLRRAELSGSAAMAGQRIVPA